MRQVNNRSIKVGDTAADLLSSRNECVLILSDSLKTRNGKVRA
jgi:hypothetical protein